MSMTQQQSKQFDKFLDKLVRLVERERGISDYYLSRRDALEQTSEDANQYVEFVKGEVTYKVQVTAERT